MYAGPAACVEREVVLLRWLKLVDTRLSIKWIEHVVKVWDVNEEELKQEGRYALTFLYPSNDPMTAYARQIGREHPYDVLGWFCEDMTVPESRPIPPDEMEPVVREFLGKIDGTRRRVKDRMKEISGNNKRVTDRNIADASDEMSQHAMDLRRTAYGIPFVNIPMQLN